MDSWSAHFVEMFYLPFWPLLMRVADIGDDIWRWDEAGWMGGVGMLAIGNSSLRHYCWWGNSRKEQWRGIR